MDAGHRRRMNQMAHPRAVSCKGINQGTPFGRFSASTVIPSRWPVPSHSGFGYRAARGAPTSFAPVGWTLAFCPASG